MQMKMVSDKMQDKKQKVKAADSDESFQGDWLNLLQWFVNIVLWPPFTFVIKMKWAVVIYVLRVRGPYG